MYACVGKEGGSTGGRVAWGACASKKALEGKRPPSLSLRVCLNDESDGPRSGNACVCSYIDIVVDLLPIEVGRGSKRPCFGNRATSFDRLACVCFLSSFHFQRVPPSTAHHHTPLSIGCSRRNALLLTHLYHPHSPPHPKPSTTHRHHQHRLLPTLLYSDSSSYHSTGFCAKRKAGTSPKSSPSASAIASCLLIRVWC